MPNNTFYEKSLHPPLPLAYGSYRAPDPGVLLFPPTVTAFSSAFQTLTCSSYRRKTAKVNNPRSSTVTSSALLQIKLRHWVQS